MAIYKYRVFDLLNQTYWEVGYNDGIFYCMEEAIGTLDNLQKQSVHKNQYELHRIKVGECQTIEY